MGTSLVWPLQLEKAQNDKIREEVIERFKRRLMELEVKKNSKDDRKEKGT